MNIEQVREALNVTLHYRLDVRENERGIKLESFSACREVKKP